MADVVVCKHVLNGIEPTYLEGNPLGLAFALCDECAAVVYTAEIPLIGVPYAEAEARFNIPTCLPKDGRWKWEPSVE